MLSNKLVLYKTYNKILHWMTYMGWYCIKHNQPTNENGCKKKLSIPHDDREKREIENFNDYLVG